mmetsp:Transcript_26543/g.36281  ORF Transcript_26543/g.36281 Transcript_26543/m.36281 type:complete len:268 (+) Transcript_26543:40-843(+)
MPCAVPLRVTSSLVLVATTQDTCAAGSDEANLRTRARVARNRRGVAHVLVVTSSVRVLNRVHRRTADLRPGVALHPVLVEVVASLQHRLVHASTTRDKADNRAARGGDRLAGARRQADAGLLAIVRVAHDHARRARGASIASAVGGLLLTHGDHGTLGHLVEGHHVANRELRLGTAVHELAGVQTLNRHPLLLPQLVAVGIMEDDLAHRRTAARVMDDVLHQALDVALALRIVNRPQLHGALPQPGLRTEDEGLALTRPTDHAPHGC